MEVVNNHSLVCSYACFKRNDQPHASFYNLAKKSTQITFRSILTPLSLVEFLKMTHLSCRLGKTHDEAKPNKPRDTLMLFHGIIWHHFLPFWLNWWRENWVETIRVAVAVNYLKPQWKRPRSFIFVTLSFAGLRLFLSRNYGRISSWKRSAWWPLSSPASARRER